MDEVFKDFGPQVFFACLAKYQEMACAIAQPSCPRPRDGGRAPRSSSAANKQPPQKGQFNELNRVAKAIKKQLKKEKEPAKQAELKNQLDSVLKSKIPKEGEKDGQSVVEPSDKA
jgi:hypothetical protein